MRAKKRKEGWGGGKFFARKEKRKKMKRNLLSDANCSTIKSLLKVINLELKMNQNDIKNKAQKANEIVSVCNSKLGSIRKKQNDIIGNHNKAVDNHKIEKLRKENEAL